MLLITFSIFEPYYPEIFPHPTPRINVYSEDLRNLLSGCRTHNLEHVRNGGWSVMSGDGRHTIRELLVDFGRPAFNGGKKLVANHAPDEPMVIDHR